MAKKAKESELKKKQLTIEDLSIGDVIPDLHSVNIKIDNDLISQMKRYEQESKKSVIWRNAITGSFLFWKMNDEKPKEKKAKTPKKAKEPIEIEVEEIEEEGFIEEDFEQLDEEEEIEQAIEENTKLDEALESEIEDEENLLLDCIEDYKSEFNVKKVNTNTKKFKAFFEEWKNIT